jgi:hypothetical protein
VYLQFWGLHMKASQYTHLYAHSTITVRQVFWKFMVEDLQRGVKIWEFMFRCDTNSGQYRNMCWILLSLWWCGLSDGTCAQSCILRNTQYLWDEPPLCEDDVRNIFTSYIRTSTVCPCMSRLQLVSLNSHSHTNVLKRTADRTELHSLWPANCNAKIVAVLWPCQ